VPLYETTEQVVRSGLATFLQAFPEGTLWRNNDEADQGYDLVMLGQVSPMQIDLDLLVEQSRSNERLAASLAHVGFDSPLDLMATYAGRGPEIAPWLEDAWINTEMSLRLEYWAGLALNNRYASEIYESIARYRSPPPGLFRGSPELQATLLRRLTEQPRRRRRR
jgi:hypothetical protein